MTRRTRTLTLLPAISLALALGACGQKGPLYLPNAQKTPVPPSPGAATPAGVPPEATPLAPPANGANGAGSAPSAQPGQTPQSQQQAAPSQQAPQEQHSSPPSPPDPAPASGASPAA